LLPLVIHQDPRGRVDTGMNEAAGYADYARRLRISSAAPERVPESRRLPVSAPLRGARAQ
jgi:hypothetical protein